MIPHVYIFRIWIIIKSKFQSVLSVLAMVCAVTISPLDGTARVIVYIVVSVLWMARP